MRQCIHGFWAGLVGLLSSPVPVRLPHFGKVLAGLSVLGALALSYFAGAAVMFFELPSYDFLHKAFTGGKAWHERGQPALNPFQPPDLDEREVFLCGPPGLANHVLRGLRHAGVPRRRVHVERFAL